MLDTGWEADTGYWILDERPLLVASCWLLVKGLMLDGLSSPVILNDIRFQSS
jgi:hypothetical protein